MSGQPTDGELAYADFLAVVKALDEAEPTKDRKMVINKDLQKSLSDVLTMIQMLGGNKLEVYYGDDLYRLTLKIIKPKKAASLFYGVESKG